MSISKRMFLSFPLLVALSACGESTTQSEGLAVKQFSSGDTDPFGCPFVEPVAWVDEATHQGTCGARCTPAQQDGDFIACLGEGIPSWDSLDPIPPAGLALCHPVSGERYDFGNIKSAHPFISVCFGVCGNESVIPIEGMPNDCLTRAP